ncbi:MAG: hypothetical protein HOM68_23335 [Gemmatimonadetes bacterium]|nr:hypothetical protein [Gemmatimonadota bacterium]MBT5059498.1 hypothetical protein [Gemmatimonadota bacterium]MBT5146777.1 hypothetical protein [Gemmatimonadota bacterium]MBT5590066.1 hypothetical protein [Gemmatimonadota bacterium]MBT5961739.1 hypothetical protein [Gemmatimonadota bacterium]
MFIDIKGPRDGAPVLVTCIAGGEGGTDLVPEQTVTDTAFADAALAKDLRVQAFGDLMEDLVERCYDEGRRLFTFDTDLLDHARRHAHTGGGLVEILTDVKPALRHRQAQLTKQPRGKRGDLGLSDYLRHAGLPLAPHLGSKQGAQRLRYVRQQLLKHNAYASITGTAKAKWTKLLRQGEQDCLGLQRLLMALAPIHG